MVPHRRATDIHVPPHLGATHASSTRVLIVTVRVGLFAFCALLTLARSSFASDRLFPVVMLGLVATAATVPVASPVVRRWRPVAETAAAASLAVLLEPLPETLLPYLLAPALAAGLGGGLLLAATTGAVASVIFVLGRVVGEETLPLFDYYVIVGRWTLFALAVGLLGGWINRLQLAEQAPDTAAYASAYRLLSQLRVVSRQLSAGLEPATLAQGLLDTLRESMNFDTGAVFVQSAGGTLSAIATKGSGSNSWNLPSSLLEETWASAEPQRETVGAPDAPDRYRAAIPLQIGLRLFGVVAVERREAPISGDELSMARNVVVEQSMRLETALMFSEVRTIATAEERQRLAREIHDGVAQELASLGYIVDDLKAQARYLPALEHGLGELRQELSRIISELRLSIFDLRSEVQAAAGLGTALSDYARQVAAGTGLVVHIVLDESSARLPVRVEAELLRIAQEAITNVRKHALAGTLWVTCRVHPPSALLRIEDDGRGLGGKRLDSFGLEIMRERATRIGADLAVTTGPEGGTSVQVVLGEGMSEG